MYTHVAYMDCRAPTQSRCFAEQFRWIRAAISWLEAGSLAEFPHGYLYKDIP